MCKRISEIIQKESIKFDKSGLEAILFTAEGDMRQAINNLQATYTGFGELTKEHVLRVCDVPNIEVLEQVITYCETNQFDLAQKTLLPLWEEGYTAYDLVNTLYKLIMNRNMDKRLQFEFLKDMAQLKMRVLEGLPTFLQISGYLARCCQQVYEMMQAEQKFE